MITRLSRRNMLALAGAGSVSLLLSGCGTVSSRAGLYATSTDGAPRWIDGTTGAAVWSPVGTMLAWGDEDGVTIGDAVSGDVSHLSMNPMVGRPGWSPDGEAIAYLDAESRELKRLNIRTGETKRLASLTEGLDGAIRAPILTRGGPSWSPDGRSVAFVCWDGFGDELCLVDSDGVTRQQLTTLGVAEEQSGGIARSSVTSLAWSPDGGAIAVAVQAEAQGASAGIFVVNLAVRSGKRLTKMTANAPLVWDVASNDLFFSARVEGRSDVYRLAADGGTPEALTTDLADGAREPTVNQRGALAVTSGSRIALLRQGSSDLSLFEQNSLVCSTPSLGPDENQLAFLALSRPIARYP